MISNCVVWVESEIKDMDQVTNGPFVPEMISLWQEAQKELDGSGCISEDAALMFSYNNLYGRR